MHSLYEKLKKYMLTENEVRKLKQEGLIDENIENILYKKCEFTQYNEKHIGYVEQKLSDNSSGAWNAYSWTVRELADAGVRLVFKGKDSKERYGDFLFVTQFYLVFYSPGALMVDRYKEFVKINGDTYCYEAPKTYYMSLNIIDSFTILEPQYINRSGTTSYEVKKDPGKGALVGGIIAGAPGAIIGANMNSGTKTVTHYHSIKKDVYNAKIMIEGKEYTIGSLFEVDVTPGSKDYESGNCVVNKEFLKFRSDDEPIYMGNIIDSCQKRMNYLINRSKRISSSAERKNVIKREEQSNAETRENFIKAEKQAEKEAQGCMVVFVGAIILLGIGFFLLLSQF